jgi:GNAT superfamily N-acetyltransferase
MTAATGISARARECATHAATSATYMRMKRGAAEGGGVGRALVGAAENWARVRGRKRVVVDTGAANILARKFYAALRFEEEDITVSRAID